MNGYMQMFDDSGNHGLPEADEYQTFESLGQARALFEEWAEYVDRFALKQCAYAYLYLGSPEGEFPCDTYPDRKLSIGKSGGIVMENL